MWKYSFWNKVLSSSSLILHAFKILAKHPIMFLPIFSVWIIYAVILIYFDYFFNWNNFPMAFKLWLLFIIILFLCIIFSLSSFMLLEFIQQIETGQKINLYKALYETLFKNFIKAFPIILVWAIIWFVITIIEVMMDSKRKRNNNELSYENVAKTLSGHEKLSLINLSLDLINSGVRLIVFMIYPAIAWEDEGTINAVKKGFCAIKKNCVEFASGFIQIEFACVLICLPVSILFAVVDSYKIELSKEVWICIIMYISFAGTLYLYLQQMFAAILYMWNIKWLKAVKKAQREGSKIPTLHDVKKPDLLDNIPDLL